MDLYLLRANHCLQSYKRNAKRSIFWIVNINTQGSHTFFFFFNSSLSHLVAMEILISSGHLEITIHMLGTVNFVCDSSRNVWNGHYSSKLMCAWDLSTGFTPGLIDCRVDPNLVKWVLSEFRRFIKFVQIIAVYLIFIF